LTYVINWGDGTPDTLVSPTAENKAVDVSHVYTFSGSFTITVVCTDKDGGTSAAAKTSVAITGAAANAVDGVDPADSTKTALFVTGRNSNDSISITQSDGNILVFINSVRYGPAQGFSGITGRIYVYGQDGNDNITVASDVSNDVMLFGGGGNDKLTVQNSGNNVLVGGKGDDVLTADSGRDLLIGGSGSNTLSGGAGDDMLIGGLTIYDNSNLPALAAIMSEWTSSHSYAGRVSNLIGTTTGGANGNNRLRAGIEVLEAGSDRITGGTGTDFWFVGTFGSEKDKLADRFNSEMLISLS
jgi:Ca2+-binding RTX toxin-like protein